MKQAAIVFYTSDISDFSVPGIHFTDLKIVNF